MEYGESRFLEDVNARRRNLEWYHVNDSVIHLLVWRSLEVWRWYPYKDPFVCPIGKG